MSTLGHTQAWMTEVLRRRRALPDDPEAARAACAIATGNDRLSPAEQVEIYREQFWLRHTLALVEDYEALCRILGQAAWERLVEEYLEAHPPASWSLRDLGNRLPGFVRASTWLPHHELCVDMAHLEWAYVEVFDAADSGRLDPARLEAIPEAAWEAVVLDVAPALRLLRVRYPVAELRRRIRLEHVCPPIPDPKAENLVVYRGVDRELHHAAVSDGAFALLRALKAGAALVPACRQATAEAADRASEIETSLATWFRDWAARAWIVDVRVPAR